MAFQNLFKNLCPPEDGVRNPGPASTCMSETKNYVRRNVPKRENQEENQEEQRRPHKKRRCDQQTVDVLTVGLKTRHCITVAEYTDRRTDKKQLSHNVLGGGNNRMKGMMEGQKKLNQRGRGRHGTRGGHQSRFMRKSDKQEVKVKHARFMTQEFKEQNALMVDGRLLCRHFLWGRCIKGDDCQLEHIQGYNDLIKELCKFYVQGFCSKGNECPYMHKSFPCKYFHRKGHCSQGEICRFSHEPLNNITTKLLDEALKRDNELRKLAQKAEEESLEQPKNPISSMTETDRSSDILHPVRPSFYRSMDTTVESETPFCVAEQQADVESAVSDASEPVSAPSSPLNPAEPVCYSVEAVLGPQLSRPLTRLFTASGPKEFNPIYSSLSTKQTPKVPSAVKAVFSEYKSTENSVFGQRFLPEPCSKEVTHPQLRPDTVNEPGSCSNLPQENCLMSVIHPELDSKHCLNLPLNSGELWKPQTKTEPPQPSLQAFHEATFEGLSADWCSVNSTTDSVPRSSPTEPGDSSDHGNLPLTVSQKPIETQNELRRGSEERCSTKNPAAYLADSGAECKKSPQQPFHCLFATPLTELLKSSHQPGLIKSTPTSQSADGRNNQPSSSFLSLFTAPLGAPPFPPGRSSLHSHRNQRGKMETVLSKQDVPEDQPTSHNLSPNPRSQCEEMRHADEAQPDVSSHTEHPSASSVLKTLFCSLKPYQQDEEENKHIQMFSLPSDASDHL